MSGRESQWSLFSLQNWHPAPGADFAVQSLELSSFHVFACWQLTDHCALRATLMSSRVPPSFKVVASM